MNEGKPPQVRCTPTDPSIEFDVFEVVRLRLVQALTEGGFGLIEAERIALYVVGCARPVSKLLKLATATRPPSHEQTLEALRRVLKEAQTLEKARRLMLQGEESGSDG